MAKAKAKKKAKATRKSAKASGKPRIKTRSSSKAKSPRKPRSHVIPSATDRKAREPKSTVRRKGAKGKTPAKASSGFSQKTREAAKERVKKPRRARSDKPHRIVAYRAEIDLEHVEPEAAREAMQEYLKDAESRLFPHGSRIRTHAYKDDTVDAEIAVTVERGVDVADTIFALGDAIRYESLGPWYWISAGARYLITSDEEMVYRKFQGMNEVSTYWQRMTPTNLADVLLVLRSKVTTGMQRKFRRKASIVFLRITYEPFGQKPSRR